MIENTNLQEALKAAVAEAQHELETAHARLGEVEAALGQYQDLLTERSALTAKISYLNEEHRGLSMALARREGHPIGTESPEAGEDWSSFKRPEAVARALREARRPVSPADIANILAAHGRDDPPRGVSVVLMRMQKRNLVRHGQRGEWVWGGDPQEESGQDDLTPQG